MRELSPLPPAHQSREDAIEALLWEGWDTPADLATRAYGLGYQAAVLDAQARAVEHGASGGSKRSAAQKRQTARLNGWSSLTGPLSRQAPGNPWTEDEDAAVLRGEFPETHTRGACYARRSRLKRSPGYGSRLSPWDLTEEQQARIEEIAVGVPVEDAR